mmetsp:Transcript_3933/g.9866  ORF Transcript_3933/g.9866 Transcript_3933/m.9866 type:complete len:484 (+) Transcript_3933:232-1683(+)
MYEGRLRGRPKPSDDVELPLRGSGLTNRKRERASRYSDDKPEASPEGAARTLRKARPADRRWLRKALRQADAEGAGPDSGRVVRAEPGWSRSRNARIAALCERLGLRSIVATSGDGLAGVGGIPYHATSDVARRLRAGLEGTAALDDDDEDTDGKSSHDEDERLERPSIVARTSSTSSTDGLPIRNMIAESPPPPPPPSLRAGPLARCDSLVDRMGGLLRSSSSNLGSETPHSPPHRALSMDSAAPEARTVFFATPGRGELQRARSCDNTGRPPAGPCKLSFDSAQTRRPPRDSDASTVRASGRFSVGFNDRDSLASARRRRDSSRRGSSDLAAALNGRGSSMMPSDRPSFAPSDRPPRLARSQRMRYRSSPLSDEEKTSRPTWVPQSLMPTPAPRLGRFTSSSTGSRRGTPLSAMGTPQHPALLPKGHALLQRSVSVCAWGSHPEFGDFGVSEPASDSRLARLRALLAAEQRRAEEAKFASP